LTVAAVAACERPGSIVEVAAGLLGGTGAAGFGAGGTGNVVVIGDGAGELRSAFARFCERQTRKPIKAASNSKIHNPAELSPELVALTGAGAAEPEVDPAVSPPVVDVGAGAAGCSGVAAGEDTGAVADAAAVVDAATGDGDGDDGLVPEAVAPVAAGVAALVVATAGAVAAGAGTRLDDGVGAATLGAGTGPVGSGEAVTEVDGLAALSRLAIAGFERGLGADGITGLAAKGEGSGALAAA